MTTVSVYFYLGLDEPQEHIYETRSDGHYIMIRILVDRVTWTWRDKSGWGCFLHGQDGRGEERCCWVQAVDDVPDWVPRPDPADILARLGGLP